MLVIIIIIISAHLFRLGVSLGVQAVGGGLSVIAVIVGRQKPHGPRDCSEYHPRPIGVAEEGSRRQHRPRKHACGMMKQVASHINLIKVKVMSKKKKAHRCSKFNAYCLLSCRGNSQQR